MIEGHTFVTAHFTNNERTFVTSIWKDKDGTLRPFNMVAEEGNQYWKELQQYITEDELHENTHEHIKESRKAFEQELIAIAEGDGISFKELLSDENKTIDFVIDWLSNDFDNEKLFKIKLRLFEREKVLQSEDRTLKANLRKATTIYEIIEAYSKF